jgi:hypothetical protein
MIFIFFVQGFYSHKMFPMVGNMLLLIPYDLSNVPFIVSIVHMCSSHFVPYAFSNVPYVVCTILMHPSCSSYP